MAYRIGQRLYAIEWTDGQPRLRSGIVTRTGRGGVYVDGVRKKGGWRDSIEDAFSEELKLIMGTWLYHRNQTVKMALGIVACANDVIRLRRKWLRVRAR